MAAGSQQRRKEYPDGHDRRNEQDDDVTRFTGTFTGTLELPDGSVVQPTGKPFDVLFSTTARWRQGKIVEEYLFCDSATFLNQIGLG